nr:MULTISPECIES: SMP-30/gluconolactonase/LRE family protein [Brucella]
MEHFREKVVSVVKTKIFAEHIAELGEGPGYDPLTGNVWWFDILGQRLIEKNWDSGETHVHELGMKASALAVIDRNRQLIVSEHGLFIRERANGRLTLHHPLEADNEITRSNDARVHPSGAFWIGTMGKKAEKEAGSIWWYREGHVKKLFSGITITNSICFSPDGKVAYFADTDRNIIWRVDTDPETGLPVSEKSVFHHRSEAGNMDGSVVDAEGTLWNACWGGSAIHAYSPQGRLIRSVELPVKQPSCPAFVGPDAAVMIITSAFEGMNAKARQADPHAGKVLLLDLTLAGRHDPPVRL